MSRPNSQDPAGMSPEHGKGAGSVMRRFVEKLTAPRSRRAAVLPRVCTLVCVHDEIRLIGPFLDHMIGLGSDVHVLCDRSPPGVVAEAEARRGHGVVAVDQVDDGDCFNLGAQLRRFENLAGAGAYDWYIRADVDEFRLPGHPGERWPEFAARVEAAGYNAVNFREFIFIPTRQQPDHDHPGFMESMRRYYLFEPRPEHRRSMWKRRPGPVDLESTGGHLVDFPGIRVYPHHPPMRHYQFLSEEHFWKKYGPRRYLSQERARGWHGWRLRLDALGPILPDENDLQLYDPASPWSFDTSAPRARHMLDESISTKRSP